MDSDKPNIEDFEAGHIAERIVITTVLLPSGDLGFAVEMTEMTPDRVLGLLEMAKLWLNEQIRGNVQWFKGGDE